MMRGFTILKARKEAARAAKEKDPLREALNKAGAERDELMKSLPPKPKPKAKAKAKKKAPKAKKSVKGKNNG